MNETNREVGLSSLILCIDMVFCSHWMSLKELLLGEFVASRCDDDRYDSGTA